MTKHFWLRLYCVLRRINNRFQNRPASRLKTTSVTLLSLDPLETDWKKKPSEGPSKSSISRPRFSHSAKLNKSSAFVLKPKSSVVRKQWPVCRNKKRGPKKRS